MSENIIEILNTDVIVEIENPSYDLVVENLIVLDYNYSQNKPSINSVALIGNKTSDELGLAALSELSLKEDVVNKVNEVDENSTYLQYPSAKCVFDELESRADINLSNVTLISSESVVYNALNAKANTDLSNLSAIGQNVVDGQWISVSETPLSNGTVSPDTDYTYTLSFLPDDGSIYEVIGYITGRTLTTSGNYFAFYGYSSLMANGLIRAITRTTAYDAAMGTFNFIVGSDRKFWFKDTGSGATGVTLAFRAYRRIGTNA